MARTLTSLVSLCVALTCLLVAAETPKRDAITKEPYKYLSYQEMREKILNLRSTYPHLVRVESSEDAYGIPHYAKCGADT
jgi:hypothetical protein